MSNTRVLIISHDVVQSRLAGPGIRYRELARVLSRHFRVTLAFPGESEQNVLPFAVWPYHRDRWNSLAPAANKADVVIACGDTLADFPALAELRTPLVIDGYDPHTFETLALWAGEALPLQTTRHDARLAILKHQCRAGDFFICASERQRDWWLGLLEQQGRINPHTYARDPSLRRLIDVVPYGLPSEPPQARRPVLRSVWPGLGPEDPIILWGGGLWEWLDPLTALRATRHLADRGLAIRLVFPGTRHPNPDVPDMPIRTQTLALADELGLTGEHAFFGDWVPYEDWPAVLLEADVGLSLHPDTVEARLAYRSRILDYIWAGLPMVVTKGDAISGIVQSYDLGVVVDYEDDAGVAQTLLALLEKSRSYWRDRFVRAQAEMSWENAARPLLEFCRTPGRAADKDASNGHSAKLVDQQVNQALAERDAEIVRLRDLVARYEQGWFIRLMHQVHRWRQKVGRR
jgi:glycosyltransferase involved in cell wall biosynthesis